MFTLQKSLTESEDTLLFGLYKDTYKTDVIWNKLNKSMGGILEDYVKQGDISTNYNILSTIVSPNGGTPKRICFIGLGHKEEETRTRIRRAFGHAFRSLQEKGFTKVSVYLEDSDRSKLTFNKIVETIAEAFCFSTYQFPTFKTVTKPTHEMEKMSFLTENETLHTALKRGEALGKGVNTARQLVHLPANLLTASELAEYAGTLAEDYEMDVDILEKADMERLGMGALLAVNQGSDEPPKMIVIKYQGLEEWTDVTAFVGKGVTYDTGGYSIKSKTGMPGMKGDMGGAAAVLGAMETLGRLRPKKNVLAIIPSTDNMISGSAFKPDDVITSMSGQTIEVLNTDAEGRLALADGVTYAKELKADRIIDVATLTGGVVTALGSWMTGAMTNDLSFYSEVQKVSEAMGEPIWQLPYNEDYKAQIRKSDIADLNNSPTRKAHAVMGGAFVGAFVGDTPWIHLDIAGTSIAEENHKSGGKGPTGVMAKTLAGFVMG